MSPLQAKRARNRRVAPRTVRHSSAGGINLQAQRRRPATYLADALTKLVNDWPMSRIDELLPSAYITSPQAAVA
jgi:hypothetical protein